MPSPLADPHRPGTAPNGRHTAVRLDSFRTLGNTGLRVSPLALGGLTFGDSVAGSDDYTTYAILDRYLGAGGNLIDTANIYTGGRSEELIGTYFGSRPSLRDRVVISTKFAGTLFPNDPNGGGAGRKAIMQQAEESLRRLRTDYIDLYWLHNWDRHTPLEETMSTLNDLVHQGKIRYIGLSDTPAWAVARMASIAEFRGWANAAAIQVEYSLLQRTSEGELFGAARELGLGVMPWSPLANGVLSGKYTRRINAVKESGRAGAWVAPYLNEATFTLLDAMRRMSDDHGVPVAAIALAWVRQQTEVTTIAIGVRTTAQLEANLTSLEVNLTKRQLAELDTLTRPNLNFPADFLSRHAASTQQGGTTINGVLSPGPVHLGSASADATVQFPVQARIR
ncbi:aldo/keto reductase [Nonomuraea terrae]|uniref:Aldo/keto reductase n=1 Tax=Nonomuraea terrae TaxID=2530383 RepID=A0A4R4YQR1_9ACTN|nr:aldo/keto reductase [Nonomuraea terrae]